MVLNWRVNFDFEASKQGCYRSQDPELAVGFQLRARAPPIIPSIAPMKNPPIPKRLRIEKISTIIPQVDACDGWVCSIKAPTKTSTPAIRPKVDMPPKAPIPEKPIPPIIPPYPPIIPPIGPPQAGIPLNAHVIVVTPLASIRTPATRDRAKAATGFSELRMLFEYARLHMYLPTRNHALNVRSSE